MTEPIGLLQEVRNDVREIRRMLIGNGHVGVFEQIRNNTDDIAGLMTTVKAVSETATIVAQSVGDHRAWHESPDNQTLQQLFKHSSVRFAILVVVIMTVLFAGIFGVSEAYAFVKGLLM